MPQSEHARKRIITVSSWRGSLQRGDANEKGMYV